MEIMKKQRQLLVLVERGKEETHTIFTILDGSFPFIQGGIKIYF